MRGSNWLAYLFTAFSVGSLNSPTESFGMADKATPPNAASRTASPKADTRSTGGESQDNGKQPDIADYQDWRDRAGKPIIRKAKLTEWDFILERIFVTDSDGKVSRIPLAKLGKKSQAMLEQLIRQGQANGEFASEETIGKARELAAKFEKSNEEIDKRVKGSLQARSERRDKREIEQAMRLIDTVVATYRDDPEKLASVRAKSALVTLGDSVVDDTDVGKKRYIIGTEIVELETIWHTAVPLLGK